jgi:drug/metabolite transporter (DMT)-like permease
MYKPLFSLLIAFAGYSLLNISQAGQKIGLELFRTRKLAGAVLWLAATLGTSGAAFVNLYALSLGSVSLVGAMAGSGLASLALFSWLVMKEPISSRELVGIGVIFAAAVLMAAFGGAPFMEAPRIKILYLLLGSLVLLYVFLWILLRNRSLAIATVIAAFSGTLGGFVALFQKVSTTEHGRSLSLARRVESSRAGTIGLEETLSNPFALAWIALSVLSMLVIQFAYRHGKAIRIIPAFSASYIVIPIVGGMLVFHETLHPLQWLGVGSIIAGVLLLTLRAPAAPDSGKAVDRPPQTRGR